MAPVPAIVARDTASTIPPLTREQIIENWMPAFVAGGLFVVCFLGVGLFAAYHYAKLGRKKFRIYRENKRDRKHQAVVADDFFRQMGSYVSQTAMSEARSTEFLVSGFGSSYQSISYEEAIGAGAGDDTAEGLQMQLTPVQTSSDEEDGFPYYDYRHLVKPMQVTAMGRPIPMPQKTYSRFQIHHPQPRPYKLGRLTAVPDVDEMLRVGEVSRGYGEVVV